MLARLASDINVIAHADQLIWTCCELLFDHQGDQWYWKFCRPRLPGDYWFGVEGRYVPCNHWHHEHGPVAMASQ